MPDAVFAAAQWRRGLATPCLSSGCMQRVSGDTSIWEANDLVPAPESTTCVIAGGGPAFNGDTTAYEALLKARGARIVTTPMPKRLPPWIVAKLGGSFTSSVTRWDPRT